MIYIRKFPFQEVYFFFYIFYFFPMIFVLFRYIAGLLDPWVRVVGFSRFHWSSDFVLLSSIESWYVAWKCHCYQEARHFPQKVYILFLLIYLPAKADYQFFHNYIKNRPHRLMLQGLIPPLSCILYLTCSIVSSGRISIPKKLRFPVLK